MSESEKEEKTGLLDVSPVEPVTGGVSMTFSQSELLTLVELTAHTSGGPCWQAKVRPLWERFNAAWCQSTDAPETPPEEEVVTVQLRPMGAVWAARNGDRTALGSSARNAALGVLPEHE